MHFGALAWPLCTFSTIGGAEKLASQAAKERSSQMPVAVCKGTFLLLNWLRHACRPGPPPLPRKTSDGGGSLGRRRESASGNVGGGKVGVSSAAGGTYLFAGDRA